MRILWIPHAGWHIPQREHLFCRLLADRHEVHVTDSIADFDSPRDYLSRRYVRALTYHRYRDSNVVVHRIPRISPALHSRQLRRFNTAVFSWMVRRILDRHDIQAAVGTFVVPPPKVPRLVFDLFDENAAYWHDKGHLAYADEIERSEQQYFRLADAVVAASSVLADKARARGTTSPIHLIPNGVDLQAFGSVNRTTVRRQLGVPGHLVGSIGNHDSVVEVDRLLDAAHLLHSKNITFLVAGRGLAVNHALSRVQSENLPNVIIRGYVPPGEAPALVSALDVGLCPYTKSPMDDARSPMRLLMYAAAGLPTVCTDLEEVKRLKFPNVVLVEDGAASLAKGIKTALGMPRCRPPQIERFETARLVDQYERVITGRSA